MFRSAVFATLLVLAGCSSSGRLQIYLTDAPLEGATEVNVTLKGVQVHAGNGPPTKLEFDEPRTVNLLELRNGVRLLLGEVHVEGSVEQIRLLMDGHVGVTFADGSTRTARVPSGAQTGIKLVGHIDPSHTHEVLLDFDAQRSIHEAGGELVMKPVIKLIVDGEQLSETVAE